MPRLLALPAAVTAVCLCNDEANSEDTLAALLSRWVGENADHDIANRDRAGVDAGDRVRIDRCRR